jgi:molybdopterin-containing oxidoreductase family iron-sulfur binding subunit
MPQIEKADVILSLDADFIGNDGGVVEQRAFASRRKVDGGNNMSRLYTVEHHYTITGGAADHRLRVPASQIGAAALEFAAEIATLTNDATLAKLVAAAPKPAAKREWITVAAADLAANKGKSLVLAGSRQPAGVQALVFAINAALGNLGTTLTGSKCSVEDPRRISPKSCGG